MTGQSQAGKTTLSQTFNFPCIRLDGDEMRHSISKGLGFSLNDRLENNYRIARLAHVLSCQAYIIVSVIAPTEKIRSEISKICNPTWVYVHRTLPKREGHIYEEPSNIFTVNSDELRPRQSAMSVLAYLQTNGFFVK